jgi:ubiquinone/menaquinone biosynthesis C-methylase UbiE
MFNVNLNEFIKIKNKNFFLFLKKKYKNLDRQKINMLSYDRQAGSYIMKYNLNKKNYDKHCYEIYKEIFPYLKNGSTFLDAGTGEGTTLLSLSKIINKNFKNILYYAFDYSLSRIFLARSFLNKNNIYPIFFLSKLNKIGLVDSCIDIVFTNHALEPNRGQEKVILEELLRIAKKYVFLFEPIYELNCKKNQKRMDKFGYVKNLLKISKKLDCEVIKYKLLNFSVSGKNNLTGVIILKKKFIKKKKNVNFKCIYTDYALKNNRQYLYNKRVGILYPTVKSIPILLDNSAILCSKIRN